MKFFKYFISNGLWAFDGQNHMEVFYDSFSQSHRYPAWFKILQMSQKGIHHYYYTSIGVIIPTFWTLRHSAVRTVRTVICNRKSVRGEYCPLTLKKNLFFLAPHLRQTYMRVNISNIIQTNCLMFLHFNPFLARIINIIIVKF